MDNNKDFLLDTLFPKFCFGCGWEGAYLCSDCLSLMEIMEYRYCLCEKPFRIPNESISGKCGNCRSKQLAGLFFALSYKENKTAQQLIYRFKYAPYVEDLKTLLASLVLEHLFKVGANTQAFWDNAVFIPVPLDTKKLKLRGYNQSEKIASELSKAIQVPLLSNVLMKIKPTPAQMELKKEEREQNLSGVFLVKNAEPITNKKIFLVDDVYTTGSTMNECARILKEAGAKSVYGITLARES